MKQQFFIIAGLLAFGLAQVTEAGTFYKDAKELTPEVQIDEVRQPSGLQVIPEAQADDHQARQPSASEVQRQQSDEAKQPSEVQSQQSDEARQPSKVQSDQKVKHSTCAKSKHKEARRPQQAREVELRRVMGSIVQSFERKLPQGARSCIFHSEDSSSALVCDGELIDSLPGGEGAVGLDVMTKVSTYLASKGIFWVGCSSDNSRGRELFCFYQKQ